MKTLTVTRVIPAPIEKFFDLLTDHANYKSFKGVKDSRLLQEGKPDKNGLGAMRRIEAPEIWFEERITVFDRPRRFDYLIVKCSLPLEHENGSLRFETIGGGTLVTWTTTFRVKVPLLGGLLTLLGGLRLRGAFSSMLEQAEQRLAA